MYVYLPIVPILIGLVSLSLWLLLSFVATVLIFALHPGIALGVSRGERLWWRIQGPFLFILYLRLLWGWRREKSRLAREKR